MPPSTVCARGSIGGLLVFYAVFARVFFNFLGKYGSGRFSGSGADDHQLIFFDRQTLRAPADTAHVLRRPAEK